MVRQGEPVITPTTLLDLATFVNATVLFDRVFHLENHRLDSLSLNEAMGNQPIVLALPVASFTGGFHGDSVHSLGAILRTLWDNTKKHIDNVMSATHERDLLHGELTAMTAGWQTLLDLPQLDIDFLRNRTWHVASEQWSSDGPQLLKELVWAVDETLRAALTKRVLRQTSPYNIRNYLYDLIAESNYRSLFNQSVASLLALPYMPNSMRLPYRRYLYDQTQELSRQLLTLRFIEEQYRQRATAFFSDALRVPFFLGAVLQRISDRREFFEVLAEIRAQAAGFRQIRAELDAQLQDGSARTAEKLKTALSREAQSLVKALPYAPTAAALVGVIAKFGSMTQPMALAAIGVLTLFSRFRKEDFQELAERIMQPEFWFLTNIKDSAFELMNAYPKICRLWGLDGGDSKKMADGLTRAGSLLY
jgi:hypothetical protein